MIYTVTFNPSVDYVVRLDEVETGGLNRTSDTEKYAGGKGINVSRVLKQLGKESTALGFCGGFTGGFIKDTLESQGISHRFIEIEEDTRINIKLKTSSETEINAVGPKITDENIESLKNQLSGLTGDDHVVFAGSVPKGHDHLYEELSRLLFEKDVSFSIDTEGKKLTSTLQYKPYLIKPNLFELEGITGRELVGDMDIVEAAHELIERGAENVLVTLGGEGAVFVSPDSQFRIPSPEGILRNSVGAGDSTVAGFIARDESSIEERIRYAVASGSATAFSDDLALHEEIEGLVPHIEINSIEEVK
ncbi:MAG TPA: 1-phosphofructokinase [Candidatus Salinicoccus stercoripullorum]|uniref:Tagatose-6-phosphate kinase n=1 Tax=Candidatus Salinicoccus stercoripullorum TaxID=2838756 RepID=A0A9D1TZC9_9STAP|nr:1-phosphofructokinase [Candidatus Salinicoccus stercoripullorum]